MRRVHAARAHSLRGVILGEYLKSGRLTDLLLREPEGA